MNTNQQLIEIIEKNSLTRAEISDILGVSIYTVKNWLLPEKSSGFRACPKMAIKLLNITYQ
jgi:DNA-binding transcriptional regulator YiaG